uniref:Uncharacterized protein n=1 Tax=Chromera velia CCMP2878 TaxID=1169474 RepID=A0A0G4FBG1_9ALVE|eukprot:Cvel_3058.t1-p1 / transcript=Cvel_3058.t1 / gene=Cvel_3058 / organism=Chromera_velia_CCMP2878 / gene_product=hypothetical protein / transcript_product=hypothetical protein / location=Cvel_scaffold122:44358-45161(+) / protein_length=268 / sequence_SO=supercontig / SO=protein_coding / is_pseudo=false
MEDSSQPFVPPGRKFLLVRHGNTEKVAVDSDRKLTEKGEQQCASFRTKYAAELSRVKICVASSVVRTMDSAWRLVGMSSETEKNSEIAVPVAPQRQSGVEVKPLDELYFIRPGFQTPAMKYADVQLGYAPVQKYMELVPGAYEPGARQMLEAVMNAVDSTEGDVLIVGHAIHLSYLGLALIDAIVEERREEWDRGKPGGQSVEEWREAARRAVLPVNVGEVCGFEICADSGVRYLPNPLGTDFVTATCNAAFVGPGAAESHPQIGADP